jgi:uncharacterized membrane protein
MHVSLTDVCMASTLHFVWPGKEGALMRYFVAIGFDSRKEADEVRWILGHGDRRHPVDMADTAIVYRDRKSRIKLDRTAGHQRAGSLLGGLFGTFLGLMLPLPVPVNDALAPFVTGVFGAGIGALGARLIDEEKDQNIVKEIGNGREACDRVTYERKKSSIVSICWMSYSRTASVISRISSGA